MIKLEVTIKATVLIDEEDAINASEFIDMFAESEITMQLNDGITILEVDLEAASIEEED